MIANLKLQGGSMTDPVWLCTEGKTTQALTDWVRETGIPLYWRCGQGTCGACAVHLHYPDEATPRIIKLSGKERNVLLRHGKLTAEQHAAETLLQTPQLWRLACHVMVQPGEALEVSW
ncbi:2Fe-2S iron-sulfur cluster-binding protein [Leeia sp.]|uniref:2Fe-2S iron-sulfur cluster-binding protein n=1 Tax=Leeia sp. TaxID=2884678 RepID=UPI0035B4A65B